MEPHRLKSVPPGRNAMTTPTTVNVPELIDEQKVGSFQIRILILCALAALLDGFAAQMIGYLAPSLARDMHLGAPALTRIFAWGLFGLLLLESIFAMWVGRSR